jgi:hypothetical protein
MRDQAPNEHATDLALQAALGEFSAIRQRMDVFAQAQVAVFTTGITAAGVVAGLALDKHRLNLLLFISVLAPVLASTHSDLRNRIGDNGIYIGQALWPYIQSLTRDDLPSRSEHWETEVDRRLVLVGVIQAPALLLSMSVAVLVIRFGVLSEAHAEGYDVLWYLGAVLTTVSGVYTAGVYLTLRAGKAVEREVGSARESNQS